MGLAVEFLVLLSVAAASPPSHVEPGSLNAELFQLFHEPSWHVTLALIPLAPSFFEDLGNAYLAVAGLQAIIYTLIAYFLSRSFRRNRLRARHASPLQRKPDL